MMYCITPLKQALSLQVVFDVVRNWMEEIVLWNDTNMRRTRKVPFYKGDPMVEMSQKQIYTVEFSTVQWVPKLVLRKSQLQQFVFTEQF